MDIAHIGLFLALIYALLYVWYLQIRINDLSRQAEYYYQELKSMENALFKKLHVKYESDLDA